MEVLLQAFVLGAVGGLVPGAVLTILFVSVMQGGLRGGATAFGWAMLSEVLIAGGLLLAAALIGIREQMFVAIGAVGGLVLFYFAWQVYRLKVVEIEMSAMVFTPLTILVLSATNAPLYVFWTTICFPLIWQLAETWGLALAAASYFVTFEIGWAITTFLMVMIFVYSRATLTNERIMRKVFVCIAVIFTAFGIKMLMEAARLIIA